MRRSAGRERYVTTSVGEKLRAFRDSGALMDVKCD